MFSSILKKGLKLSLHLILVVGLIFPSLIPLQAGLFSAPKVPMPNANEFAGDMEKRYHVNTEAVQEQGENMNVMDNKQFSPEVSLFFSPSDPQEGQKISARAFPIYFASKTTDMYYTWYLQKSGCEENNSPSTDQRTQCDHNKDNRIGVEDWKIEAARIIATNGYDSAFTGYGSDTDNDQYQARFGGDNQMNTDKNYCYYHDNNSGENYELVDEVGETSFDGCTNGRAVCMEGVPEVGPGDVDATATGDGAGGSTSTVSGDTFDVDGTEDTITGYPYCAGNGTIACLNGTPCCVSDPLTATSCTQNISGSACSVETNLGNAASACEHLFAKPPRFTSGDGSFGAAEEEFWRTDPNDPDTANNGNKDEANIVGLGIDNFTWNYSRGDKVGVAVEGLSMLLTKHADSSKMIMWAFSKNNCDYRNFDANTGTYQKEVRGYRIDIPTIDLDLDDCLEGNLVDPVEGGQATNLEVALNATPDDPMNDASGNSSGDTITVTANINNSAQEIQNTFFDWKVDISRNGTSNPPSGNGWENINTYLNNFTDGRKLLSQAKGNGVNSIKLALNLKSGNPADPASGDSFSQPFRNYLSSAGTGYLRFRVTAAENFNASGANRRGSTDIIVKFTSSSDRIAAYIVGISGDPARLSVTNREICSGQFLDTDPPEQKISKRLDAKLCRVINNEIIGLRVLAVGGLTSYNWTINGLPLVCNSQVSTNCTSDDQQGEYNFFPVIGNVGDVFTVTVSATRAVDLTGAFGVEKPNVSSRSISISRSFKIVEPGVAIESADTGQAWPKVLGRYTDANGVTYPDYSKTTLQAFSGSTVKLRARFTPDFLGSFMPPQVERSWTVDDEVVGDGSSGEISFDTLKAPGSIYNITLDSVYRPSTQTRKALQDIWKISALDSTETYFKTEIQLEHPEQVELGKSGPNKYLALLSSYLPAPLLFSIRIFLSVGLIIFVTGFLFALIPNAPARFERFRHD